MGKFNLEKGIFPRTLDRYPLDRYELEDKTIPLTFIEVDDYNPHSINRVKIRSGGNKGGIYKPPVNKSQTINSGETYVQEKKEFMCKLDSFEDFPPL